MEVDRIIQQIQEFPVAPQSTNEPNPPTSYNENNLTGCKEMPPSMSTHMPSIDFLSNSAQNPKDSLWPKQLPLKQEPPITPLEVVHLNVLTIHDLDHKETQLRQGTTLSTEVLKRFKELTQQYRHTLTSLDQNKLQLRFMSTQPKRPVTLMNDMKEMQDRLATELQDIETEIDKLSNTPSSYHPIDVVTPIFGSCNDIRPNKFTHLPDFEPLKNNLKCYTIANMLIPYMTSMGLTEQAMKDVFYSKIKDASALEAFEVYKSCSFVEIVRLLSGQFDKPTRKRDYINDLLQFRRKPDESLTNAIHRLRMTLTCLQKDKPDEEKRVIMDMKLKEKLHSILSQEVWTAVLKQCRENEAIGHTLSTEEILDICLRETDERDNSTKEVTGYLFTTRFEDPHPMPTGSLSNDRANHGQYQDLNHHW
jgi:hypothetical protein